MSNTTNTIISTIYTFKINAQIIHRLSTFTSVKLNTTNYFMWIEQIQSIMEGQGIECHIFNEPPYSPFNDDKVNDSYVS